MSKYIFLGAVIFSFYSCRQSITTDKAELREIFKTILKADLAKTKQLLVDSIDHFNLKSLNESGKTFWIASLKELKTGTWKNGIFNRVTIVSRKYLDSIAGTTAFKIPLPHYSLSLPYFSKDGNSFVIYYDYYCGPLCAESSLRLYRKINGNWTFVKNYYYLVS